MVVVVGDVNVSRKAFGRHLVFPLHASIQEHCRLLGFDNLAPIIWYTIANAQYEMGAGGFYGCTLPSVAPSGTASVMDVHAEGPNSGILTLPTTERLRSGNDAEWKSTTHLVSRAVGRFMRAGGRTTEGDAAHLLEGIAVVAFDRETGAIDPDLPPAGSGLRWIEFIEKLALAYEARFGEL